MTFYSYLMLLILNFSPIPFKLLQVYPEGKMSQHFATLKSGDVVEVKGYVIHNHKLTDIYCTLSFITDAFFLFQAH